MTEHVKVHGALIDGGMFDLDGTAPGTFCYEAYGKGMFYLCPCGCGQSGFLGFRGKSNPERPSWVWDGNLELPTLEPSIRRTAGCRWHGFLKAGTWEPCDDSGVMG